MKINSSFIYTRAGVVALVVLGIVVATMTYFSVQKAEEHLRAEQVAGLVARAELLGDSLQLFREELIKDIELVGIELVGGTQGLLEEGMAEKLATQAAEHANLSEFFLLDTAGAFIASSSDEVPLQTLAELYPILGKTYAEASSGSPGEVSVSEFFRWGDSVTLGLMTPVADSEGTVAAVLLGKADLSRVSKLLEGASHGLTSRDTHILDRAGRVILTANPAQKLLDKLEQLKDRDDLVGADGGQAIFQDDQGRMNLLGYASTGYWRVVVMATPDSFEDRQASLSGQLMIDALGTVLLGLVIVLVMVRLLVVPVIRRRNEEMERRSQMAETAENERQQMLVAEKTDAEEDQREQDLLEERVASLLDIIARAAEGDLRVKAELSGNDTAARLAEAFNKLLENMRSSVAGISGQFDALSEAVVKLSQLSKGLSSSTGTVIDASSEASNVAERVNRSMDSASETIESVSERIREIEHSSDEANRVARKAAQISHDTNELIRKLTVSSAEVGKVVDMIKSIADQTNMLSLNATIEAASAGDAGKGFAVVASEVKNLARQTSDATGGINDMINSIRSQSDESSQAMNNIAAIIAEINNIQETISMAVQEQSHAMNDINTRMQDALANNQQITVNVERVSEASQNATECSQALELASDHLDKVAAEMELNLKRFQY